MRLCRIARCIVCCSFFFCIARVGLSEGDKNSPNLSASQVLASYEKQLGSIKGVRLRQTTQTRQSLDGRPEELVKTEELELNLDRSGRRVRVLREPILHGSANVRSERLHVEQLVLPHKLVYLTANQPDRVVKGVSSKRQVSEHDWQQFVSLSYFSVIFGYLPLEQQGGYIPTIMQGMNVTTHSAHIDNALVTVLEGKSTELELSLWLDPSLHYAARRITFQRDPHVVEVGSIASYAYQVSKFGEVDGHIVPVVCDITTTKRGGIIKIPSLPKSNLLLPTGERKLPGKVLHRTIQFGMIDLNPEFSASDFELTTPIPNGTPVFMRDAANLAFVWQAGKILPALDKAAVRHAKESRFVRGSGAAWLWFILSNAVLLPAVLWLFLRGRSRGRRQEDRNSANGGGNL